MTRSLLFVPADSPHKFQRAQACGADALIIDLEDSVAAAEKTNARQLARQMLEDTAVVAQRWVRVNALDSGLLLDDLSAIVPARPFGIVLPKCSGAAVLRQVSHYLDALEAASGVAPGSVRILIIATETAASMFGLDSYAGVTPRLWGISWGAEDLAADLGSQINRTDGRYTEPYRLARSLCLYAAAAAGVRAIDTVCVELDQLQLLGTEAQESYRDGFVGKLAIHPRHIDTINRALSPSDDQLDWARRVIAAFAETPGASAFRLDGKMVDQPHLRLAHRLLGAN